jgi:hypothetical protein
MLTGIFQPPQRILQPMDDMQKSVFCQQAESSESDMINVNIWVALVILMPGLMLE